MAQRLDQLQRIFYGDEVATQGTDPTAPTLGTATEFFLATGTKLTLPRAYDQRRYRALMGYFPGKIGDQGDPGIEFTCELRNQGSASNLPDIDPLLTTVFGGRNPAAHGVDVGVGTTCTGSTTGSSFTLASRTNFPAGSGIMVENPKNSGKYEASVVDTSGAGAGVVTLKQALSFTPDATGANVKAMVTYNTADTGHQSLSFQVWLDADNYVSFVGCLGTAVIDLATIGAIPMVKFKFMANAWSINNSVGNRPGMTLGDVGGPPVALAAIYKRDATKTDLLNFSLDLGSKPTRKKSQQSTYGTFAQIVSDRTPSAKATYYNVDETQWTEWAAGTQRAISYQLNNAVNKTVAVVMPKCDLKAAAYGSDSGKTTDQVDLVPTIVAGGDDVFLCLG